MKKEVKKEKKQLCQKDQIQLRTLTEENNFFLKLKV